MPELNTTFNSRVNNPLNAGVHGAFTLRRMEMRTIDRALQWANKRGWNRSKLAFELGESPQTIYNWTKRGMPPEHHEAVATLFGRSVDELLGLTNAERDDRRKAQPLSLAAGSIAPPDTDGAMTMRLPRAEADSIGGGFALAASAAPPDGYVRLSVLGEAAAGAGRMAIDSAEIVPQIDVLESWIRTALRANPARLRVLTARGHSMPGVAEDGDVMFVEPCTTFETDGIYVLTVGELLRVKRLRLRLADRQISIESTDGSAPEMVPVSRLDDDIRIQGRVVGAWTLRRF